MSRSGPGWCPFATQVEGVTTFGDGVLLAVGFCDHAAGGFLSTMRSASFWNGQGVSTHFAVGRDGSVIQLVNIFDVAWAQGRLGPTVSWLHWQELGSPNPNTLFISTEHEDWYLDANRQSHAVPGSEWTPEEYAADLRLKRWCLEEARRVHGLDLLRFGIDSLAGHYMFDSVNRAECPGRFWRDEYRQRLYNDLVGAAPAAEDIMQRHNATAPNLRGIPLDGPLTVPIAAFDPPLPPGTRMIRLEVYAAPAPDGSDPELQVFDGGTGAYAGEAGWGRGDVDAYAVIDVDVTAGGFDVRGKATIAQLGVVGVWS